jgi:asparagine synthase (glutamine-hydrolysing)
MCGIIGSLSFSREGLSFPSYQDLLDLKHRGPDSDGLYEEGPVRLGHTRLAILDLTDSGSQPMVSADNRYVIVFNGEIYNYREISVELGLPVKGQSDTEVLLQAYATWGPDCLQRFIGMFAIAIWDTIEERLFLARDRLGEKPLYVFFKDDVIYFSSEIKPLLGIPNTDYEINLESVNSYLHYQYVPEPETLVHGVSKLPAAHYLEIDKNNFEMKPVRYWSIDETRNELSTVELDIHEKIARELEEAVKLCLRSDVPIGVALSSGLDSSAIAAMAQANSSQPLHAFSIGYPGRPPFDEREDAKNFANALGMIFHEVEIPVDQFVQEFPNLVRSMDDPVADIAAYGHYMVPKAIAETGIKVMLSGLGGDEFFWGYEWVRKAVQLNLSMSLGNKFKLPSRVVVGFIGTLEKMRLVPPRGLNFLKSICAKHYLRAETFTPTDQHQFYMSVPAFREAFDFKKDLCTPMLNQIPDKILFSATSKNRFTGENISVDYARMITDTWFTSNCLVISDRVGMAHGVETRLPFANHNLIELAMQSSRASGSHLQGNKVLLRQALANWLPEKVVKRKKAGFRPPTDEWMIGVINEYANLVQNGKLQEVGVLKTTTTESSLKLYSTQSSAKLFFVFKIVLLEIWVREYLEG